MDILKTNIVVIGTRRYRRNPIGTSRNYEEEEEFFIPQTSSKINDEKIDDDEPSCVLSKKIEEETDINIETCSKTGQFKLELNIAAAFYGYIIGKNGEQKRRLESDTKTTILIPSRNAREDATVIILGATKSNIISCKNRLSVIVNNARQKQQFNHLITFPLIFDLLKEYLNKFKDEVLKKCLNDRGVDESVFVNQNKIHLTLGILVLMDTKEKNEASNIFDDCNRKFIKPLLNGKPLKIHLKGLEYMNDDPSSVDVLYIKVKTIESDNNKDLIQVISDYVVERFENSGFMKKQFERVKLHATVMNSLCRVDNNNESNENEFIKQQNKSQPPSSRESFDARNILKYFGDYDFGQYIINQMDISIRFTAEANGYYQALTSIKF